MIYEIAGLRVLIKNRCKFTEVFCEKYLSKDQDGGWDIQSSVTDEEFFEEKKASPNFPDGYIENICIYRNICRQMPAKNRMLLHSAVLEYEGNAYAFLGRSGTGKSTHTGLWLKNIEGTKILNGDKPILEIQGDKVFAYGTPWMGKESFGYNGRAQLKGICFLEQAKTNEIVKLSTAESATRIFTQILLPEDEDNATKTLELTDKFVTNVPAYLLKCDISEDAVKKSFEALTGKNYNEK